MYSNSERIKNDIEQRRLDNVNEGCHNPNQS